MVIEKEIKPKPDICSDEFSPNDAREDNLSDHKFTPCTGLTSKNDLLISRSELVEKAERFRGNFEDVLFKILDDDDPVLYGLRKAELKEFAEEFENILARRPGENPEQYMHRRFGGVYFAADAGDVQSGEHQAVAHIGNGLILKTKLAGQELTAQVSGERMFIRLGARPYRWDNLTAEDALAGIEVDVPVVPTQYFRIQWIPYEDGTFPAVVPVESPPQTGSASVSEAFTGVPTFAVTQDLSQGGKVEVREVGDPRNKELENYSLLESKLDQSVKKILQYCKDYCEEQNISPTPGYQVNFSFHANPKDGFSLYESEARSCFFILVGKSNPASGTLVIGDLDGLGIRREKVVLTT